MYLITTHRLFGLKTFAYSEMIGMPINMSKILIMVRYIQILFGLAVTNFEFNKKNFQNTITTIVKYINYFLAQKSNETTNLK